MAKGNKSVVAYYIEMDSMSKDGGKSRKKAYYAAQNAPKKKVTDNEDVGF